MAFKICIDAGHYGLNYNQSTTKYKGYYESAQMWKLHLLLKKELEKYDCEVITTRKNTNDLALYDRGLLAKGCDLFLSMHSNASTSSSTDYVVVFRGIDEKADELGLKLAQAISEIMDCKQIPRTAEKYNSSKTNEYYGVLRGARAVGVIYRYIVEHGFHTNEANTNWLLDNKNLVVLAETEAKVIAEYFKLKPKFKEYQVKIIREAGVPVRKESNSKSEEVTRIACGKKRWIIEERDGFGLLKNDKGWIRLGYTERV